MSLSTGTVVFEDATLKAVELVAETMTLNNFSVSATTSLQQATNTGNVTTNTVEFTNPTTAFVTTGNVEVGGELTVASNVEVGTANLFVDTTTGRVGVGTDSPSYLLDARGSGDAAIQIRTTNPNGDNAILYFNGSSSNQRKCAIISKPISPASWCKQDLHFCMETNSNGDDVDISDSKMVITNNGNVGIGITNPSAKLHVNGNFYAPGSVVQLQNRSFCLSYSSTSTTFTYTGAYVDITPKFANSKLFVMFDGLAYAAANSSTGLGIQAYRSIGGGSDQQVYAAAQYPGATANPHDLCLYVNSGHYTHARISISFGDTPNTTSSIRYKIYARAHLNGVRADLGNSGHQPLTFSVFEIAQ